MSGALAGADGRLRCPWALAGPDHESYHDLEWGRAVSGERELFERLSLEAFQSGLSWITILRKRPAFREAWHGFDPAAVAAFDDDDVARLLADAGIVRNQAKIRATIANARALQALPAEVTLHGLLAAHTPRRAATPVAVEDVPAKVPESVALANVLRSHGFSFVGPTTVYAMMQATGYVNDHLAGCWVQEILPAAAPAQP